MENLGITIALIGFAIVLTLIGISAQLQGIENSLNTTNQTLQEKQNGRN